MQTHRLIPHRATPALGVSGIGVRLRPLRGGRLMLRWRIDDAQQVVLPPEAPPARTDRLWEKTCLELFLADGRGRYREFNFSPSGQWAAYAFKGYRKPLGDLAMAEPPAILTEMGNSVLAMAVFVPLELFDGAKAMGLSAVIEERGGHKSYWALRHRGATPDFHNATCFAYRFGAAAPA